MQSHLEIEAEKPKTLCTIASSSKLYDIFFLKSGRFLSIDDKHVVTVWNKDQSTVLTHSASLLPEFTGTIGSHPNYYMCHLEIARCLLPEGPVLSKIQDSIPTLTQEHEDTYRLLCKDKQLYKYTNYCGNKNYPITKWFFKFGNRYIISNDDRLYFFRINENELATESTWPIYSSTQCHPISSDEIVIAGPVRIQFQKVDTNQSMTVQATLIKNESILQPKDFPCKDLLITYDENFLCLFKEPDIMRIVKFDLKTKLIMGEIIYSIPFRSFLRTFKSPDNRILVLELSSHHSVSLNHYYALDPVALSIFKLELDPKSKLMDINDQYQLIMAKGPEFSIIEMPQLNQYQNYLERDLPVVVGNEIAPFFNGATAVANLIAKYIAREVPNSRNLSSFFKEKSLATKLEKSSFVAEKDELSGLCPIL